MKNSINSQFKMRRHGGAVQRANETSPGSYSVNQERTMAQMGMAPTNYGTPALTTDPKKPGVEIGKGASNKLDEVILTAKSPQTIKKQVETNISKAHPMAGNYRTASPERQQEIQAGKFTSGGSKIPLGTQDLRIYNRLKSK